MDLDTDRCPHCGGSNIYLQSVIGACDGLIDEWHCDDCRNLWPPPRNPNPPDSLTPAI